MAWNPVGDLLDAAAQTFNDIYYGSYNILGVPQDIVRDVMGKTPYNSFQQIGGKWVSNPSDGLVKTKPKGVTVTNRSNITVRAIEESDKPIGDALDAVKNWLDSSYDTTSLDTASDAATSNPLAVLAGAFGGGGGTSAADRLAALKAQNATRAAAGILDMINSGSYASPYTALKTTLADYLGKAQTGIEGFYSGAEEAVKQAYATNPYANFSGTSTVADSGLEGLLTSQGASTDPLAQMVAANRENASGRAAAITDLARIMGANFTATGQQAQTDIGTMKAGALSDLLGSGNAYQAAIATQQGAALKALQDQLMTAANLGADLASLVKKKNRKG